VGHLEGAAEDLLGEVALFSEEVHGAAVVAVDPEDLGTGGAVAVHAALGEVVVVVGEDLEADEVDEAGIEGHKIQSQHPLFQNTYTYTKYTFLHGRKFLTSFATDFNLSARSV
jgi:hypothetical protein